MFSDRLDITEIVVLLDKRVEHLLICGSANLTERDPRGKLFDCGAERRSVNIDRLRRSPLQQTISVTICRRRKLYTSLAVESQEEAPADRILQLSIGLGPIPRLAQPA
jgi:hypothetical protein